MDYENLTAEDIVLVDTDGNIVEGKLRPSSDTPTHIELYKAFSDIGGVVHTHSEWAVSWAQSRRGIPCYGTTHATPLGFIAIIPFSLSISETLPHVNLTRPSSGRRILILLLFLVCFA